MNIFLNLTILFLIVIIIIKKTDNKQIKKNTIIFIISPLIKFIYMIIKLLFNLLFALSEDYNQQIIETTENIKNINLNNINQLNSTEQIELILDNIDNKIENNNQLNTTDVIKTLKFENNTEIIENEKTTNNNELPNNIDKDIQEEIQEEIQEYTKENIQEYILDNNEKNNTIEILNTQDEPIELISIDEIDFGDYISNLITKSSDTIIKTQIDEKPINIKKIKIGKKKNDI